MGSGQWSVPETLTDKNAKTSAAVSISLAVGVPAPWPARVSMRMRTGRWAELAACRASQEKVSGTNSDAGA